MPELARKLLSNAQLEAALLNSLLSNREGIDLAMKRLNPYCFYEYGHQLIYDAIREVYASGVEVSMLSVSEQLFKQMAQDQALEMIQKVAYLASQQTELMTVDMMVAYLVQYSQRRKLMPVAQQLQNVATTLTAPLESGLRQVQDKIFEIMTDTAVSDFTTLTSLLAEALQHIADNDNPELQHMGILTEIPTLDQSGGLPQGLVVVAGRSSHGKTSLANYMALMAMRSGRKVAYYSMEMTNLQLTQRLLAMESGINANVLAHHRLTSMQKQRAHEAAERLIASHADIFSFDSRGINHLDAMLQSIRALKRSSGLDLVVVDYIQLLGIDREQRDENSAKLIGRAAHAMHNIAIELGLTILCLSQVNRNVAGIPSRSNIRDSGEVDEAADATIIVYRAECDKLQVFPSPYDDVSAEGRVLIAVDKFRNGAPGHCFMRFEAATTSFLPLEGEDQEPLQRLIDYDLPDVY